MTALHPGALLAEVTRSDARTGHHHVETVHAGHLVVVDGAGAVLAALGAPEVATFVRSAAKPFQATACLELLVAADDAEVELDPAEVAVAWASHRGEPDQLEVVRRLLSRSGTPPERLTCPPAASEVDPGAVPQRLLHNCSGKHALFALAGSRIGVDRALLLDRDAAVQRHVIGVLETVLGAPSAVGVDGCGAPAVAVPLAALARGFAALAVEPRFGRVREAGLTHPGLIGGSGRLESALLGAGVVAKSGAEGVYAAGWLTAAGVPRGLGIKAVDGASRGVAAALTTLLEELGAVPRGTWTPPPPLGGGRPVGEVRTSPQVRELAAAAGVAD